MISKVQNVVPLSSSWTVKSMVSNIRSIIQEDSMLNITDRDIRGYINLGVSNIYSMLGEKANDDYGMLLTGHIDTIAPTPNINLTKPVANTSYLYTLNANSLGVKSIQPTYSINPYIYPQGTDPAINIFGGQVSANLDANYADDTNLQYYSTYFVPYTVISRIVNVAIAKKTIAETADETDFTGLVNPISDTLRRASLSEILYWHKKSGSVSVSTDITNLLMGDRGTGAWSYFGGLLYFYLGIDIAAKMLDTSIDPGTALTLRDLYDHDYIIYAIRSPLLDNLVDIDNPISGYWAHIDLSDSNMRLLSLLVQKMSMEHLGKQISTDAEMLIRELTAKITQNMIDLPKIEAQDRLKVDQGFTGR